MKIGLVPRIFLGNDWSFHFDPSPMKAYYANHLSAVFGALTALFMSFTIDKIVLVQSGYARYLPVFLFAFTPLIWEYSVTAEVFALNNFLCSVILYLSINIYKLCFNLKQDNTAEDASQIEKFVLLGAFLSGLALSNQHTSLLHVSYLILSILGCLFYFKIPNTWRIIVKAGVCSLLGLAPYVYLFLASQNNPEGSWGDTSNISGLFRHILRAEYGTFRLGGVVGNENWLERIILYLKFMSKDTYYLVLPVVSIGVFLMIIPANSKNLGKFQGKNIAATIAKREKTDKKGKKSKEDVIPPPSSTTNEVEESNGVSIAATKELSTIFLIVLCLWLYYVFIWHCIFSNLPLSAPMPYGVHARFWMQPNIVFFVLFGVSLDTIITKVCGNTSSLKSFREKFETIAVMGLLSLLLFQRIPMNNRSELGWIIHKYGEATLKLIPTDSLLLSHTDIDLNSIRYLRVCEGMTEKMQRNIHHFSTQMMPYEWFEKKQAPHFKEKFHMPDVHFPEISTDRKSVGNRRFITNLLKANGVFAKPIPNTATSIAAAMDAIKNSYYPGGVYLDMQAINDVEILDMNEWNSDFSLIPWGNQYRVVPNLLKYNLTLLEDFQVESYRTMKAFEKELLFSKEILISSSSSSGLVANENSNLFHVLFPVGTWESAVLNIYYDLHNQYGLFLLTYAMHIQNQKDITLEKIPIILDRLMVALDFLELSYRDVARTGTISSSVRDLFKNTALAYMRFHGLITVVHQFKDKVLMVYEYQRANFPVSINCFLLSFFPYNFKRVNF